jgi:hypothetical protein
MKGFWYRINKFSASLTPPAIRAPKTTLIKGPGSHITDPGYLSIDRPWWGPTRDHQRGRTRTTTINRLHQPRATRLEPEGTLIMELMELIATLQRFADDLGERAETTDVRLAFQPNYPLEFAISSVALTEPEGTTGRAFVHIGNGVAYGYLPAGIKDEVW